MDEYDHNLFGDPKPATLPIENVAPDTVAFKINLETQEEQNPSVRELQYKPPKVS